VRLVDLVAGMSRLADLGFGLPPGESLRPSALAVTLARPLDLPDEDVRAGLYTGLMLHAGCVGFARETAQLYGDEFTVQMAAERANRADARDVATTLVPRLLRGRPAGEKARSAATAATRGRRQGRAFDTASCEVGRNAARRLGLPENVQASVYHAHEWWNGGGAPEGLAGDDIPLGARLTAVTSLAALFEGIGGPQRQPRPSASVSAGSSTRPSRPTSPSAPSGYSARSRRRTPTSCCWRRSPVRRTRRHLDHGGGEARAAHRRRIRGAAQRREAGSAGR
jgi:hypothetical protein